MAYLATLFVLLIIFGAFKITDAMDRRDEKRKAARDKGKPNRS
jgi:hypothetical protein